MHYYEDMYELWGIPEEIKREKKTKEYILQLRDGWYVMDEDGGNILEVHDKSCACTFDSIEDAEEYSRKYWIDARVLEVA